MHRNPRNYHQLRERLDESGFTLERRIDDKQIVLAKGDTIRELWTNSRLTNYAIVVEGKAYSLLRLLDLEEFREEEEAAELAELLVD